jgi:hypothetical protein
LEWAEKTPAKTSDLSKLKISKTHGAKRKAWVISRTGSK